MSPPGHRRSDLGPLLRLVRAPSFSQLSGLGVAALTQSIRIALAPLVLGTTLLSIRNAFRRAESSRSKLRKSSFLARLFTRDSKTRAPIHSLGSFRDTPSKGASVPFELDPPFTRAFRRRATHVSKMRPTDFCNLHFQRREPVASCCFRLCIEVSRPDRRTVR